jgi:hypothetical protein
LDNKIKGTRAQDVALKVAIDQIFWYVLALFDFISEAPDALVLTSPLRRFTRRRCPIFMTVFFTYLGLVNGDSFGTIKNKIKSDLLSACQGSWKVWP